MVSKKLKLVSRTLDPIVIIGKHGINDNVILQIRTAFKKRRMIKVRFLRSFIDGKNKKEVALELAESINANLVEVMGLTASFSKK